MQRHVLVGLAVAVFLACSLPLAAQQTGATSGTSTLAMQESPQGSTVPRVIQFSGVVKDANGTLQTGAVSLTFVLYGSQDGGTALWSETQTAELDAHGNYTVLLGANSTGGVPLDLFTTVAARWLGVQPQLPGFPEQPRVLLVGVPYAMKAADADTLGGLPASAFVKAPPTNASGGLSSGGGNGTVVNPSGGALSGTGTAGKGNPPACAGSNNYIPLWHPYPTLCRSAILQITAPGPTMGFVGINQTNPSAQLDVTGNINTSAAYNLGGSTVLAEPGGSTALNTALGYQALSKNTTGTGNTASGYQALLNNTGGNDNVAAGYLALYSNSTGGGNAAFGNQALSSNTTGNSNTATGFQVLFGNTTGGSNTANGYEALFENTTGSNNTASGTSALFANTTGSFNTANGTSALFANTTGSFNTAIGSLALESNTTGGSNTASGLQALQSNTTGGSNTADGYGALNANTTGGSNTANGYEALYSNTTGGNNTAIGFQALFYNATGSDNTASGFQALLLNTTGSSNTANGDLALEGNLTGNNNTASGYQALAFNSTGFDNTATGYNALENNSANYNTADGNGALESNTTGTQNTAMGSGALLNNNTGSNNIAIGNNAGSSVSGDKSNIIEIGTPGASGDQNLIRIGTIGTQNSFFTAGVRGVPTGQNNAVPVLIDSNGQLGTISSSRRFKEDIHDMGDSSEGLMRLRPVTFRYKKPFDDGSKPIQYGLIAEEVAEVFPDLVARSADGQIETVKYQLLDPMLLNEVQRQQFEIRDQKALVLSQQRELKAQRSLAIEQQSQLKIQQTQIRQLASQVMVIQASLHHRRGNGTARLASAKDTPAPAATDASLPVASAVQGGN